MTFTLKHLPKAEQEAQLKRETKLWEKYYALTKAIEAQDPFAAFNATSRGEIESVLQDGYDNEVYGDETDFTPIVNNPGDFRNACEAGIQHDADVFKDMVNMALKGVGLPQ